MIALDELSAIRQFGEMGHRMTCSDPDDSTRRTTYSDLGKLAAALEAVLERHESGNFHSGPICLCCDTAYPCATVQLVAKALS